MPTLGTDDQLPADLADLAALRVPRYTSYPTAPHFHAPFSPATHRQWLADVPATAAISLYLHIPFCQDLCWYCGCSTQAGVQPAPIAAYAEDLLAEIDLVAAALGRRQPVARVHWGGGTPLSLAPGDLRRINRRLRDRFDVAPTAEIAIEVDPRRITAHHLVALADCGVNRVSLGVQDLDPEVQRRIGREQPFEVVAAAVAGLRMVAINRIGFDLIYGLPGQTTDTVARTARDAVRLAPDRLAIFGYAHVPWARPNQRLIDANLLPDPALRWQLARVAERTIRAAGYQAVGLDHFARADDGLAIAAAAGQLRRGFQGFTDDPAEIVVGLGASSISTLPDGYAQNAPQVPAWRAAIRAGEVPTARGRAMSDDDRLRRRIVETLLCNGSVDVAQIAAPEDLATLNEAFTQIDQLVERGVAVRDGYRVALAPGRQLLARVVAAAFDAYLTPHGPGHAGAV